MLCSHPPPAPDLRAATRQLRALLRIAAGTAIPSAASAGCTDELADPLTLPREGEVTGWTRLTCDARGTPLLSDPLRPAERIDFVAIDRFDDAPRSNHVHGVEVVHWGVPCIEALDRAACLAELATARDAPCEQTPCTRAVIEAGGRVQRVTQREILVRALGSIDGVSEALLLAGFEGHPVKCSDGVHPGTSYRPMDGGHRLQTVWEDCGNGILRNVVQVSLHGEVSMIENARIGSTNCVIGRRPAGMSAARAAKSPTPLGAYFANAARLEAASVYAFRQLAEELSGLSAPEELSAGARAALSDELSHAAAMQKLAARFGGSVSAPEVHEVSRRELPEIAIDNIVEGCVRETFGALVASHQAAQAEDPEIRALMRTIAADETRHAALAWSLAAWLEPQLSAADQKRVAMARGRALRGLQGELASGLSKDDDALIGYPGTPAAVRMLARLTSSLAWRAGLARAGEQRPSLFPA